jgi:hypothetical protein
VEGFPGWVLAVGFFRFRQFVEVELKCAVAQYAMAIEHHQGVWDGIGWGVFHLWVENTDFEAFCGLLSGFWLIYMRSSNPARILTALSS